MAQDLNNSWRGEGRLTKDAVILNGAAKFTLAVNNTFAKEDSKRKANFIPCVLFGEKNVEFAKNYLKKGTGLKIEGTIITDSYVNKAGEKVFTMEVKVNQKEFIRYKKKDSESTGANNSDANTEETDNEDDFIPLPDDLDDDITKVFPVDDENDSSMFI